MKGYKIVVQSPSGKLLSCSAESLGEWTVRYRIGEPTIGMCGTPLFVFKTIKDAKAYISDCFDNVVIYACEYKPYPFAIDMIPLRKDGIELFWKTNGQANTIEKVKKPRGCDLATSVILGEEIYRMYMFF